MPGDETLQRHDDSESEGEEDALEAIPKLEIDIDPSTLTPLSPEVISKQVGVL
jgi:translation initiation factor 2 subunit 3